MTSSILPHQPPLSPTFEPHSIPHETISTQTLIDTLRMIPHPEGGYFSEIDRDVRTVANPFKDQEPYDTTATTSFSGDEGVRNASTSILYLLTPHRPQGVFHRNRARTVHTLIQGRGRYVVIHDDEGVDDEDGDEEGVDDIRFEEGNGADAGADAGVDEGVDEGGDGVDKEGEGSENVGEKKEKKKGKKRIETFLVGKDVEAGERVIWIVEGGKYKASFLVEEDGVDEWESRLLISETVVPGFEYADHDFLREEKFDAILEKEQADELRWLVRREG